MSVYITCLILTITRISSPRSTNVWTRRAAKRFGLHVNTPIGSCHQRHAHSLAIAMACISSPSMVVCLLHVFFSPNQSDRASTSACLGDSSFLGECLSTANDNNNVVLTSDVCSSSAPQTFLITKTANATSFHLQFNGTSLCLDPNPISSIPTFTKCDFTRRGLTIADLYIASANGYFLVCDLLIQDQSRSLC
jgi:hypothetical protein